MDKNDAKNSKSKTKERIKESRDSAQSKANESKTDSKNGKGELCKVIALRRESNMAIASTSGLGSANRSSVTSMPSSPTCTSLPLPTLNFIEDLIQSELKCAICQEVLINTINLNCSHVFCECCISEWLRNSHHCPVCRVTVGQQTRVLALDNLLSRYFEHQKPSIAGRRKELIEERRRQKQAQQRRWQRRQRDQDMIVTRRNIRLLHEPLADLDLSRMALEATSGLFPNSPYRLLLNRTHGPSLLPQFGRHFQPAVNNGRAHNNGQPRIDLSEHGLIDLELEFRDRMAAEEDRSQAIVAYLGRVGRMVDHVYRVQSYRERNRRQHRAERHRNNVDTEQMRRLRDQERTRRAQRLARRDFVSRFELDLD